MKKFSTLLLAGLLLAGLTTGCKDKKAGQEEAAKQEQAVTEAAAEAEKAAVEEEAAAEEEDAEAEEEEEAAEEAAEVDEAMFIKAAYEVSCVKAKVDNPEEQKEILEVVYPRYGFETVEEYAAAETALKDSTSVKAALDEKMKDCTVEAAKGFKTAGAGEAAKEEEAPAENETEKKEDAKPKAAFRQGTFTGSHSGNGIEGGKVNCTAFSGEFKCLISGKAEGKSFSIPATGKISSNGSYSASGNRGQNTVSITGKLKGTNGSGKLTLSVFQRNYTTTWN